MNARRVKATTALALLALGAVACEAGAPAYTALTPRTHDAFPIERGAHGGIDCNECHGAFDTFTQFTCIDCHAHERAETDANHAGVEGYAYESERCYACHPDGSPDSAGPEHELKFPIADGTVHADAACSSCHFVPGDRKQIDCLTGCHEAGPTSSAHGPVGGYRHATADCLRCHADSQVDRVSSHAPFRIASGFSHHRESCLRCHPAVRADKPFPAADFGRFDCLACHPRGETDDEHEDEGGYRYASDACYECHESGEGDDD